MYKKEKQMLIKDALRLWSHFVELVKTPNEF